MSKFSNLSILVVEDDDVLRRVLIECLSSFGCQLHEAGDGNAAFEIVKKNTVDLIFSDVKMPHCGGIDLLEKLQTLDPRTRPSLVLVTGFSEILVEEAVKLGALSVLHKPLSKKSLLQILELFSAERAS